jgi:hypothetical protein
MKQTGSIFSARQLFLRSCLESTPNGGTLRAFNANPDRKSRSTTRLYELKQKLLQAALERTALPQAQRQLCGAANTAAEMAWETACPLLVYPCLFDEMAATVLNRHAFEELASEFAGISPADEKNDPLYGIFNPQNSWPHPISQAKDLPTTLTLAEI